MKKEILDRLVANTLALLTKEGMGTFARFTRTGGRPRRFSTRTPYHGGNAFALWATALMAGYSSPFWITFKQAEEAGARIRKGERGTPIIYADRWKPEGAAPDDPGRMFMRHYTVFNAEQVEGMPADCLPAIAKPLDFNPIPAVETFIANTGAQRIEGVGGPFYRPSTDTIHMPDRRSFTSEEAFYATELHELAHWTGDRRRLNRDLTSEFASTGYAREELIAEMASALLCADLGLSKEPREDHATYLAAWLKKLKEDPMELWTAARAAEKVSTYLADFQAPHIEEAMAA